MRTLLALVAALIITTGVQATESDDEDAAGSDPTGPYCGVYSVYAALRLEGRLADLTTLLKPDYVGSEKGSSLFELRKAAIEHGLHAVAVENLTTAALKNSRYRMVLHVKEQPDDKAYGHYFLFCGMRGDRGLILDPPRAPREMGLHELAALWDGSALALSSAPIDVRSLRRPVRMALFVIVMAVLSALLLCRLVVARAAKCRRLPAARRSAVEGGLILVVGAVAGLGANLLTDGGVLKSRSALAALQRAHVASFASKVDGQGLLRRMGDGTLIVDARMPEDFRAGHINGAVNLPPRSPRWQRRQVLKGVARGTPIVIYCQSPGCPYAELVARDLSVDGFDNLSIFKGGWVEWQSLTE